MIKIIGEIFLALSVKQCNINRQMTGLAMLAVAGLNNSMNDALVS